MSKSPKQLPNRAKEIWIKMPSGKGSGGRTLLDQESQDVSKKSIPLRGRRALTPRILEINVQFC